MAGSNHHRWFVHFSTYEPTLSVGAGTPSGATYLRLRGGVTPNLRGGQRVTASAGTYRRAQKQGAGSISEVLDFVEQID